MNAPAPAAAERQSTVGRSLYDASPEELASRLAAYGEPAYRARQIWEWLYHHRAESIDAMTSLPRRLRERLAAEYTVTRLRPVADRVSADGWTRKIPFALPDGSQIETVLMGYARRRTVCVSTQAGCAMGCPFCATGQSGWQRNLSAGEIVEQVLYFDRDLRAGAGAGTAA